MNIDRNAVRICLESFDFGQLFTQELGWDYASETHAVTVGEATFTLETVAEKHGVRVMRCSPLPDRSMPDYALRKRIDTQVTRLAFEHLLIFSDADETTQVWQWVSRTTGRPPAYREIRADTGTSCEAILQKLHAISFSLGEEEGLTLDDVRFRLRDAMDRDRVTKAFYDRFKVEQGAFQAFITGIAEADAQRWYSSVMLNRLMFIYFIQKKGFLDGDQDYLRNRLRQIREARGPDHFHSFYQY